MERVLQGNIRFGLSPSSLVPMGDTVHTLVISSTMSTIAVPVTPDVPEQGWRMGSLSGTLQVGFTSEVPAKLAELAWQAQRSSSATGGRKPGELYFAATVHGTTPHPTDNPEYAGWVLPQQVNIGGQSWSVGDQSVTWPISRGLTIL